MGGPPPHPAPNPPVLSEAMEIALQEAMARAFEAPQTIPSPQERMVTPLTAPLSTGAAAPIAVRAKVNAKMQNYFPPSDEPDVSPHDDPMASMESHKEN